MGITMGSLFKFTTLVLILFSIPAIVIADEKEKSHSLILSGGRAMALNGCQSPWATAGTPSSECSESSSMYRVAYNYKLTPSWSIEISGGDLGSPYVEGTYQGGPTTWEMKINGWTVAGIGFIRMGSSFSMFGKLGYVRSHFREHFGAYIGGVWKYGASYNGVQTIDEDRNGATYGAGFQIDFTKTFGLRFQYENFGQYDIYSAYGVSNPDKISISTVSAGLAIHF